MPGRRSCACPNRLHEHGCYLRYNHGPCRCPHCRAASTRRRKFTKSTLHTNPWIQSVGTARRLQALAVAGWPPGLIAAHLGVDVRTVEHWRRQDRPTVSTRTAKRITNLCADLWDKKPTCEPRYATRVRRAALRKGWAPLLAWDDIDDPKEEPNLGDPKAAINQVDEIAVMRAIDGDPPSTFREVDKREAVFRLDQKGLTHAAIARRLRMNRDAVDQYFTRRRRAQKQEEAA